MSGDDGVAKPGEAPRWPVRWAVLGGALMAALLAGILWPIAQVPMLTARNPLARAAASGCDQGGDHVLVYRVTLLRHGGAVCSALVRRDTFYSYMLGVMVSAHWERVDCEINKPGDLPYCASRVLDGSGSWLALAAPPPPADLILAPDKGR